MSATVASIVLFNDKFYVSAIRSMQICLQYAITLFEIESRQVNESNFPTFYIQLFNLLICLAPY